MKTQKRDHRCIWFKHLNDEFASRLGGLEPDENVELHINGQPTRWARMKPGQRPTNGIRVVEGLHVWKALELEQLFELDFVERSGGKPRAARRAIANVKGTVPQAKGKALFGRYAFADYSGARDPQGQKRAIVLMIADKGGDAQQSDGRFTREALTTRMLDLLRDATENNIRMCGGFDHQFSVPWALLEEVGIRQKPWREAIAAFIEGAYDKNAPRVSHPANFARQFNDWTEKQRRPPYFYSATKGDSYGIPIADPRRPCRYDVTRYRLTERSASLSGRGSPKPFNRVGDNGSVGGQTLTGLLQLFELMRAASAEGIPLRVWPFDGLDLKSRAYDGCHVLFEPYPAAVRDAGVEYNDKEDAKAAVVFARTLDQVGQLAEKLDLSGLSPDDRETVRLEGWIAGHEA